MEHEPLRYERLADDLSSIIAGGNLRPGDRLPSVRRLSRERRLSVSTVLQALHQLEDRGLVEARPQSGYFVRHAPAPHEQPNLRSTPDEAVPVDVSQRLMRVLQTSILPGVAPLAAALPSSSLMPLAVLPWVVYLALPVSVHPLLILLPSAVMLGTAVDIAAGTFKKYL